MEMLKAYFFLLEICFGELLKVEIVVDVELIDVVVFLIF